MSIKDNIDKIRSELPDNVILLVATKTRSVEEINEAIDAGITDIGESKIQEAEDKMPKIKGVKKHFIGHLQSNKARKAVELFEVIQSVDSFKIAKKISDACVELNKTMDIMIEVNVGGEKSKFGIASKDVPDLYTKIKDLPNINLIGLMAIVPFLEPFQTKPYFKKMVELNKKLKLEFLSMGMTHDYQIAVQEGSNMVRIGTAIFGEKEEN